MTLDIAGELGAVLDGVVATGGGHTLTFRYLPWGRHWDGRRWPDSVNESVVTVRGISTGTTNADIGGGAQNSRPLLDVHLYWNDDERITDPDAFRKAVVDAVAAAIRAQERSIGASPHTSVSNVVDLSDLVGDGTSGVKHEILVSVRGFLSEVYG